MVRGASSGDETTRRAPSTVAALHHGGGLAITLLAHPRTERVGDVYVAPRDADGGASFELSRKSPIFTSDEGRESPLADSFVSRRPIRISLDEDGLTLEVSTDSTAVDVDGVRLTGTHRFARERLRPGLVLVLADRIALLLHLRGPLRFPRLDAMGILGESEVIEGMREAIRTARRLTVPVLIRGESGSGKELVARALASGTRPQRPFVAINLAALPHTLAPSELFGHEQGAFTGAQRAHLGAFVRADGGTLFLDEVGDATPEVQAMLLRALETGEILPVGSSRPRTVDVQVIAATDADIENGVAFKSSLLHRLSGFRIDVPSLSARPDDVARLLVTFVSEELRGLGCAGWPGSEEAPWLSARLVARLVGYAWPGNVRQLRNVARAIAVQAPLAEVSMQGFERSMPGLSPLVVQVTPQPVVRRKASELSDDELLSTLEQHGFRLGAVARALGVSRPALYDRIDKSERIRKAKDVSADEIRALWDAQGGDAGRIAEVLRVSPRGLVLRIRELGLPDASPTVG